MDNVFARPNRMFLSSKLFVLYWIELASIDPLCANITSHVNNSDSLCVYIKRHFTYVTITIALIQTRAWHCHIPSSLSGLFLNIINSICEMPLSTLRSKFLYYFYACSEFDLVYDFFNFELFVEDMNVMDVWKQGDGACYYTIINTYFACARKNMITGRQSNLAISNQGNNSFVGNHTCHREVCWH